LIIEILSVEILAIVAKSKGTVMARAIRKSGVRMIPLSEIKDDLSRFLREAGKQDIVITRHGKPAGVLIGFASEDDWFEYRLETDPRFLRRVEKARASLRAGHGVRAGNQAGVVSGGRQHADDRR
jgi:prevent-host-death family protein